MSDQQANPYVTPESEIDTHEEEYAELRYFTANGRLGRLRYLAYGVGVYFVAGLVQAGAAGVASLLGEQAGLIIGGLVSIVVGIGVLVLYILWTIQRINDFNLSGWLTFLFILPIINFALWFIPGSDRPNRYGPMPPRNGIGVILLSLLMPILIIGILAAIAIPAYHDYSTRAQIQEGTNLTNPARTALNIACAEDDLANQNSNELLGLKPASDYGSDSAVIKSIVARGLDETSGKVVVTFKQMSGIPEDAQLVYHGQCGPGGMTWTVSTANGYPEKYRLRF